MSAPLPHTPSPCFRSSPGTTGGGGGAGYFPHTQWSAISNARGENESAAARGMHDLASGYWQPLYLYLRRKGESHDNACDSVQGFFEHMLGGGFLPHIDREGGRFRSVLLKSLDRWRSRARVRDGAQKRGGGVEHLSFDGVEALRAEAEADDGRTPEEVFDRRWATELMARAAASVQDGYARRDREAWFEALKPALPGGLGLSDYGEVAARLGASEGALRKAVHDLRAAFAARLKEEIRATVRSNEEAEAELRYLISVFAG